MPVLPRAERRPPPPTVAPHGRRVWPVSAIRATGASSAISHRHMGVRQVAQNVAPGWQAAALGACTERHTLTHIDDVSTSGTTPIWSPSASPWSCGHRTMTSDCLFGLHRCPEVSRRTSPRTKQGFPSFGSPLGVCSRHLGGQEHTPWTRTARFHGLGGQKPALGSHGTPRILFRSRWRKLRGGSNPPARTTVTSTFTVRRGPRWLAHRFRADPRENMAG